MHSLHAQLALHPPPAQILPCLFQRQLHARQPQQELKQCIVAVQVALCDKDAQGPWQLGFYPYVIPTRVKLRDIDVSASSVVHLTQCTKRVASHCKTGGLWTVGCRMFAL